MQEQLREVSTAIEHTEEDHVVPVDSKADAVGRHDQLPKIENPNGPDLWDDPHRNG